MNYVFLHSCYRLFRYHLRDVKQTGTFIWSTEILLTAVAAYNLSPLFIFLFFSSGRDKKSVPPESPKKKESPSIEQILLNVVDTPVLDTERSLPQDIDKSSDSFNGWSPRKREKWRYLMNLVDNNSSNLRSVMKASKYKRQCFYWAEMAFQTSMFILHDKLLLVPLYFWKVMARWSVQNSLFCHSVFVFWQMIISYRYHA